MVEERPPGLRPPESGQRRADLELDPGSALLLGERVGERCTRLLGSGVRNRRQAEVGEGQCHEPRAGQAALDARHRKPGGERAVRIHHADCADLDAVLGLQQFEPERVVERPGIDAPLHQREPPLIR